MHQAYAQTHVHSSKIGFRWRSCTLLLRCLDVLTTLAKVTWQVCAALQFPQVQVCSLSVIVWFAMLLLIWIVAMLAMVQLSVKHMLTTLTPHLVLQEDGCVSVHGHHLH